MKVLLRSLAAVVVTAILATPSVQAQKRPLDHGDYALWKRIQGETLSPDGGWLAYALVPGDGDGELVVRAVPRGGPLVIPRGSDPTFTDDSRFLVFTIEPTEDDGEDEDETEEEAEEDTDDEGDEPTDTLGILAVGGGGGDVVRIAGLQSFRVPEEGAAVVAYLLERPDDEEDEGAEEEAEEEPEGAEEGEEDEDEREKAEGAPLLLRDLASGEEHRFEDVTDYAFTEDGAFLYFAASNEDGSADGVYRVETASGGATPLLAGEGAYTRLTVSEATGAVAFLSNRDDWEADEPAVALYAAATDDGEARLVASTASAG
ncbi:MAG TPA: hypothetical protein VLL48_00505, partial [Longimicrobiales bacterium]|nr:hypothetical protein [Longimicrobiales bacterium]